MYHRIFYYLCLTMNRLGASIHQGSNELFTKRLVFIQDKCRRSAFCNGRRYPYYRVASRTKSRTSKSFL